MVWDGSNQASGVYLIHLHGKGVNQVQRLELLK